ncbi:hypothetical protein DL96DRAFT_1699255 [Flagelloscypha sp. PMI_526]|nr:hypothetical protein DL96DRAFT_1699255 [Flagelloscypha sp. PMI_526]
MRDVQPRQNSAQQIAVDHDNVRDLFRRFKAEQDKTQQAILANTLIREMAIHSDSEEISVYNDLGKYGLGNIAAHNREEHAEVKKLVYAADDASIDQGDYVAIMSAAVEGFLDHAGEEERDQLPKLVEKLSAEENDALAREFLKARRVVPTRPHPSAPVSGGIGQKAAGLQGKLHDKVIETLGGRKFADVKYAHSEV